MEADNKWALNLCRNIRYIRSHKKMRQADLADVSGINLRYYQSIESGKANITLDMLGRIAKTLEVSSNKLVGFNSLYIDFGQEELLKKLAALFDSYEHAVLFMDNNTNIHYCNNEMSKLTGFSKMDLQFKSLEELIRPEDADHFKFQSILEKTYHDSPAFNINVMTNDQGTKGVKAFPIRIVITRKNIELGNVILFQEVNSDRSFDIQKFYDQALELI